MAEGATRARVLDVLPVSCGQPVFARFDVEAALAAQEATDAPLDAWGLGVDRRPEHAFIAAVMQ